MEQLECEFEIEGGSCQEKFTTLMQLVTHQLHDHGVRDDGKCRVKLDTERDCEMEYWKGGRIRHIKTWHQAIKCKEEGCTEIFHHKQLMLEHFLQEHGQKCEFEKDGEKCGMSFGTETELARHMSKDHSLKYSPVCRVLLNPGRECRMTFCLSSKSRHVKEWHQVTKCEDDECEKTFPHKQLMLQHFQEEHGKKCDYSNEGGEKCLESFRSLHALAKHKSQDHGVAHIEVCRIPISPGRECSMEYCYPNNQHHNETWHQEVTCRKEGCNANFLHNRLMREHYEAAHKTVWTCKNRNNGCHIQFKTKEELQAHEPTCDPSKRPIACGFEGCSARFTSIPFLKMHLYTKHELTCLQIRDYLKGKDEEENSDDESEDDDADEPKSKKPKQQDEATPSIPIDPESGAPFKMFKFGKPKWNFKTLDNQLFTIFYDYGLRIVSFAFQILAPEFLTRSNFEAIRRPTHFRLDREIPKICRRGQSHFIGFKFVRGHVVRFSDYRFFPDVGWATCKYSNILPMYASFNGGVWQKVENAAANFANLHLVTYVVTVGILEDPISLAGPKALPVPDRYAKILLGLNPDSKKWDLKVYDVVHRDSPNQTVTLGKLDEIEECLGIHLFPGLASELLGMVEERD